MNAYVKFLNSTERPLYKGLIFKVRDFCKTTSVAVQTATDVVKISSELVFIISDVIPHKLNKGRTRSPPE